jgi:phytoene dehydrogenase-like protein
VRVPFIIIGGGLSGLAAAIRFARYSPDVLLLEKHNRLGGLNSYYYRNTFLLETGLHAVTNYASPDAKQAPLNRLFRQLKLSRKKLELYPQYSSEIRFPNEKSLVFTNDFEVLRENIFQSFPACKKGFIELLNALDEFEPFVIAPFQSAKKFVFSFVGNTLLTEMLLCPLMYYGSSVENDMDLNQFVIMFRAIYQEGMFRPAGTIKTFLDTLSTQYHSFGGSMRLSTEVKRILHKNKSIIGVELHNKEVIECDYLLSTIGLSETYALLQMKDPHAGAKRLGFVESIFLLPKKNSHNLPTNRTIIFYNNNKKFHYKRPENLVDFNSGVICFPGNFAGRPTQDYTEVRSTHLSNYDIWKQLSSQKNLYSDAKKDTATSSSLVLENFVGKFKEHVIYQDTFTPLTIKRFTSKLDGAIYGSPIKVKDGNIGFANLFLAGTDQGFLGIIGSMLSGVSIVNQHVLPKI